MTAATGIPAALGAPFVMTIGFIVWDKHWTGSAFALNLYKCTFASVGFLVLSITTRGDSGPFPSDIFTTRSVGFLMLSSTIGILVGDWTWLEALRLIGARRVIVVDTIKPFLAALFGWAILGEKLSPLAFVGMALTVFGVLLVSLEKEKSDEGDDDVKHDAKERREMEMTVSDTRPDGLEATQRTGNDSFFADGESKGQAEGHTATCSSIVEDQASDPTASNTRNAPEAAESFDGTDKKFSMNEEITQTTKPKHRKRRRSIRPKDMRKGYVMAVLNVGLDTYGSLLTKEHGVGMTTWEINLIRFGFASASCLSLSLILHLRDILVSCRKQPLEEAQNGDHEEGRSESNNSSISGGNKNLKSASSSEERSWYSLPAMKRRSWVKVSIGVVFVTFLCPALSNYALFQIALALALTLGSIGPLYALPLTWLLQKERPTLRSCLGALVAVAGIAVLSFFGTAQ